MKVAVVGSRDFPDLAAVRSFVETLDPKGDLLISGGARGVDLEAERIHLGRGGTIRSIHPDWTKHGRAAGLLRNQQVVDEAERVVAFWTGRSRGTRDTIERALKSRKRVEVVFP